MQPYPITNTTAAKALHIKACDQMLGWDGPPMLGCDTCTRTFCPDVLCESRSRLAVRWPLGGKGGPGGDQTKPRN